MDNKSLIPKVRLQKSAVSMTVVFLSLILGFVFVNAYFGMITNSVETYNATLPSASNATFRALNASQAELEENIQDISDSVSNITVQTGVTQFLWNSFQGLGSILTLPLTLINVATDSMSAFVFGFIDIPTWVQSLLIALILIIIALVIIAAMTGGNPNI